MSKYAKLESRDSLELESIGSASSIESLSVRNSTSSNLRTSLQAPSAAPRPFRSYSISSAFDFHGHLVPLTASDPAAPDASADAAALPLEKHKTLTYLNSLALILGIQIGSGIFSSPSEVNNHAGAPGVALIIWALAGLLAWTGAASYAELGGVIPLNGGAQAYLRYCYGESLSFVFAFCAVAILKPGSNAIIAIIFGEYFMRVVAPHTESAWANKAMAVAGLLIVTTANALSTRLTTRIGDVLMFVKVGSLIAVTIVGIIVATTGLNADGKGASHEWKEWDWFAVPEGKGNLGELAVALYAGLWAYDGWDNVNYVTGEMKNARRDLPRVIHTAMPVVISTYLLANVSYYLVLPKDILSTSRTIAVAFGQKSIGLVGGLLFAIAVTLSCFGALNASTFTSGRLVHAAGKEGYMPSYFGQLGVPTLPIPMSIRTKLNLNSEPRENARERPWDSTPIAAITFNAFLTLVYILSGGFSTLVTLYGTATYTFYFLCVLGLILLRYREPDLDRPYKCWISTPFIFCCVSLFLVARGVIERPKGMLLVLGVAAVGYIMFWFRVGGGWTGFMKWAKGLTGR